MGNLKVAQGLGSYAGILLGERQEQVLGADLCDLSPSASSFASDMTRRARSVNLSSIRVPLTCYLKRISLVFTL